MRGRNILALSVLGVGLMAGVVTYMSTKPVEANQWKMVYSQEFTGESLPSDWTIIQQNGDNHGQKHIAMNKSAVTFINNDHMRITTRRHCVNDNSEVLNDSNATEGVCPSDKITRYSTGRVVSQKIVDGSQPFRAEIRARINWNGVNGTRPSLWMRNSTNLANCAKNSGVNDPYGELDILEWYSHMPTYTWSTSHITCYHSETKNTWHTRKFSQLNEQRANDTPSKPKSLADEWHTWAVEYDGKFVRYFVDDRPVTIYHYTASDTDRGSYHGKPEDFSKLINDPDLIKRVFNDKWFFILNDYVEKKSEHKPPVATDNFRKQTFDIDYVRVYQRSAPAPNTPAQLTISGTPEVGKTLTANVSDKDGTTNSTIRYQWLANGVNISGATSKTYTLTAAEVGKKISVKVNYTDDRQFTEDVTSTETAPVVNSQTPANPNNPPVSPDSDPNLDTNAGSQLGQDSNTDSRQTAEPSEASSRDQRGVLADTGSDIATYTLGALGVMGVAWLIIKRR